MIINDNGYEVYQIEEEIDDVADLLIRYNYKLTDESNEGFIFDFLVEKGAIMYVKRDKFVIHDPENKRFRIADHPDDDAETR